MAGDIQVNLEKRVGNVGRLQKLGQAVKQYATRIVLATALVAGAGYAAGCGEISECCKERNCGPGKICEDTGEDTCKCVTDYTSKYQTQEFGLSTDDVFDASNEN